MDNCVSGYSVKPRGQRYAVGQDSWRQVPIQPLAPQVQRLQVPKRLASYLYRSHDQKIPEERLTNEQIRDWNSSQQAVLVVFEHREKQTRADQDQMSNSLLANELGDLLWEWMSTYRRPLRHRL